MKRNRHIEEQTISTLKANKRSLSVAELARQNAVTDRASTAESPGTSAWRFRRPSAYASWKTRVPV